MIKAAKFEISMSLFGPMTEFFLLRHGETAWNIEKVFRGQAEVPLNENGRKQAELAAGYYKGKGIEAIYSSPLERAWETAQTVGKVVGLEPIPMEAFGGMNFGRWQGRPHKEVQEEYPDLFELFHRHPDQARIPEGESFQEVMDRGMKGLEELVEKHPDGAVLIVSHRVINKLLLLSILGLGPEKFWQIRLDTCSTCRFLYKNNTWILRKVNENFYLRETHRDAGDF